MKYNRELPPDTNRRTGRSTRQADELIQELFEKETIFFHDHAQSDTNGATQFLARKIIDRMKLEHFDRPIYCKQLGRWYGITIKFAAGQEEKAFRHLSDEFQKVKFHF